MPKRSRRLSIGNALSAARKYTHAKVADQRGIEMTTIVLSGSKLYRDLWVTVLDAEKQQYEIEGSFGIAKGKLSPTQIAIVKALAYGDGVQITEDGKLSIVGECDEEDDFTD